MKTETLSNEIASLLDRLTRFSSLPIPRWPYTGRTALPLLQLSLSISFGSSNIEQMLISRGISLKPKASRWSVKFDTPSSMN